MACCCCCWCTWLLPDNPSLATKSRFLGQSAFNLYKLILAVYFVFWCMYWPVGEDIRDAGQFVTYWTFYVGAIYFVVSTMTACGIVGIGASPRMSRYPEREETMVGPGPASLSAFGRFVMWLQIFSWNVACLSSLVVVLVFWGLLYSGGPLDSVDINAHILIAIIMFVDQFLVATEFRMKQLWASELFGALYITFNIIFYFTAPEEDRLLYSILDWEEEPVGAIIYTVIILGVLIPIFAVIHLGVFSLRERTYKAHFKQATSLEGDGEMAFHHVHV